MFQFTANFKLLEGYASFVYEEVAQKGNEARVLLSSLTLITEGQEKQGIN